MATHTSRLVALSAFVVLGAECRLAPRYARPNADVPAEYRGARVDTTRAESLGEAKWSEVFRDEELQKLIREAVQENYDIRIAATRVLQARAQLTITRADQLPTVTAEATATNERTPTTTRGGVTLPASTDNLYGVDGTLFWELDFWGKFRSATEAEKATLLGTQWAARAVLVTVVSSVAQSYFTLRELDLELEIAQRALAAREESLRLTRVQEAGGVVSLLDVRQAEQLVYTAASVITNTQRLITQQENALSILVGQNPGPIQRGLPLVDQPAPPEVPTGLPSALLERRPDIRQAEQTLIAANARIGVAKAALFPQITLTANRGFQSNALSTLLSGPAELAHVTGSLVQQLFDGGRLRANVKLTEAQKLELVFAYLKSVQQGFREVSDALVGHRKAFELRQQLTQLVSSTEDAARLSDLRYRGGVASYLEVLTSQTSFLNAELTLAQARLGELLSLVQLYAALGGGWEQ
jgi:multidrug efflux system outer membrane protein